MLSANQCIITAYLTDGDIICPECANKRVPVTQEQLYNGAVLALEIEQGQNASGWEEWILTQWVCGEWEKILESMNLRPIIQYTLDSEFSEDGAVCGDCGCILIEPDVYDKDWPTMCSCCGLDFPDSTMISSDEFEDEKYCVECDEIRKKEKLNELIESDPQEDEKENETDPPTMWDEQGDIQ